MFRSGTDHLQVFRCKILKNRVRNVVFYLETPEDNQLLIERHSVENNNKRVVSDGNYTYLHDCMYISG